MMVTYNRKAHAQRTRLIRICALADSLSLPRSEPAHISAEETWPARLESLLVRQHPTVEILNFGQYGRTVDGLIDHFDPEVRNLEPSFIILQVGIVDCTPRVIGPLQKRVLGYRFFPPVLRKRIVDFAHRYRREIILAFPNRVTTPKKRFERG